MHGNKQSYSPCHWTLFPYHIKGWWENFSCKVFVAQMAFCTAYDIRVVFHNELIKALPLINRTETAAVNCQNSQRVEFVQLYSWPLVVLITAAWCRWSRWWIWWVCCWISDGCRICNNIAKRLKWIERFSTREGVQERAGEVRKTLTCTDPYTRVVGKRVVYLVIHGTTTSIIPNFTCVTLDSLLDTFHGLRKASTRILVLWAGIGFNISIEQEQWQQE